MKLDVQIPKVSRSANFKESQFVVGNVPLIMEVMRSKIYSVPIRTIVQEISCNARDAHREIGKHDVPIVITLPNSFNPYFIVRDYGPGISPERIENVFVKYGVSTKSDSNDQTGGFGLGAKSPWAYTDSFNITTIVPEDSKLIKREYIAYIDESRMGKLALASEEETTEPQGTAITVLSKNYTDHTEFARWTEKMCRYWTIKPQIKGVKDFSWVTPKYQITGDGWRVRNVAYNDPNYYKYEDKNDCIVLVDEIPYKLHIDKVPKNKLSNNARSLIHPDVMLEFKTGEVSLTANREDIDYRDAVIEKISDKLEQVVLQLVKKFSREVTEAKTLWEARCLYFSLKNKYNTILPTLTWNNIALNSSQINPTRQTTSDFYHIERTTLSCRKEYSIIYQKDALLCIEDTDQKRPSKSRLATVFDQNPNVTDIHVIVPRLNNDQGRKLILEELEKRDNLSLLSPIYLSTIDRKKIARDTGIVQTRVYLHTGSAYVSDSWGSTELTLESDEGIYVFFRDKKAFLTLGPDDQLLNPISSDDLRAICKKFNIKIYGIPRRYISKIGPKWKKLKEFIESEKDKLKSNTTYQRILSNIDDIIDHAYASYTQLPNLAKILLSIKEDIADKDSVAYKYITLSQTCKELREEHDKLLVNSPTMFVQELSGHNRNKSKIQTYSEKFRELYPILSYLAINQKDKTISKDILNYINFKNQETVENAVSQPHND